MEPPADQPESPQPINNVASEEMVAPGSSQTPETNQNQSAPAKHRASNKFWILFTFLALLIAAGILVWRLTYKPAPTAFINKSAPSLVASSSTFFKAPATIQPIDLFTNLGSVFGTNCTNDPTQNDLSLCPAPVLSDLKFYQIGKTKSGQAIDIVDAPFSASIDGEINFIFINDAANHYTIYGYYSGYNTIGTNVDSAQQISDLKSALSSNVTLNTTSIIQGLQFPATAKVAGLNLVQSYYNNGIGYFIDGLNYIHDNNTNLSTSDIKLISTQSGINLYDVMLDSQPTFQIHEVDAAIGGVSGSLYKITNDPIATAQPKTITWADGSVNTAQYSTLFAGCGSAYGYVVPINVDTSTLTSAGTTESGLTIYQLPSNSPFLNFVYTSDYNGGQNVSDTSLQNLTLNQFQQDHSLILVKNVLGDWVAYIRSDLLIGGGCGKPVIYLYPTHTTNVSVRVGAVVTKSSPIYPAASGWQDVTAQPNGSLDYQGKPYKSLYWEGNGFGVYPEINAGTVVTQSNLISTIQSQLLQQGLNNNEIKDFLAYWQTNLPKSPFVRLTWFNTQQMNLLAPLRVSPVPDTVIRVFLDYQGLTKPEYIAPQHFQTPARRGFTVVEWGGLIHNS